MRFIEKQSQHYKWTIIKAAREDTSDVKSTMDI